MLASFLALASGLAAAPASEPPARRVPVLRRAPRVEALRRDLAPGLSLTARPLAGASATLSVRVGIRGEVLYLGVDVRDAELMAGDRVTVSLHFPEAGVTAGGYGFLFGPDGQRGAEEGTPGYAEGAVESSAKRVKGGLSLLVAIPPLALPRFPAHEPLVLELCVGFDGHDADAGPTLPLSTCTAGAPVSDLIELPDGFRRGLRVRPPEDVLSVEPRAQGWIGYGERPTPRWVLADQPLTAKSLRALVTDAALDPEAMRIYIPERMTLPGGGAVLGVLVGQDPFASDGTCAPERTVHLALFLVKGRVAERVLEWPAISCALGRALSVSLEEDGELTVGYSSGATARFSWSRDHFERTEYGGR